MAYRQYNPHSALADYIDAYWVATGDTNKIQTTTMPILPTTSKNTRAKHPQNSDFVVFFQGILSSTTILLRMIQSFYF